MRHAIAVVVVLAACGTDALSIDDYPDAVRDARCSYLVRCGEVEDLATCRASNTGVGFQLSASLLAGVAMNKVKFESGDAQTCLDAFAARSCDVTSKSYRALPQECFHIASGTLHGGATCGL